MLDTHNAPLDAARAIAPIIEADAETVERDTRITQRIHDALAETGLLWMMLPREYGGVDADVATMIEVIEEIARADGSTGWSFFANVATLGALFQFLPDETVALLFENGEKPIFAGQLVAAGRSEKVEGGYRCSGRHGFASGSAFANWLCASQVEYSGGEQVIGSHGYPRTTIALLRRDEVEFQGNWDVMGLVGTASYDYQLHERVIPDNRVVDGMILSPDTKALRGNAALGMGALALAYAAHSGCALGIAKRMMQEIAALTSNKTRLGYTGKIAEDAVFLNEFAMADAQFRAAHGRLIEVFSDAEAKVAGGAMLDPTDHAILHQTATWAHRQSGEVAAFAFRWAGTTPVRNPSVLGRCMRDMLVTNSHMLFDAKTLTDAGPALLARWMR